MFLLGLPPAVFQAGEGWSNALLGDVFQLFSSPVMKNFNLASEATRALPSPLQAESP